MAAFARTSLSLLGLGAALLVSGCETLSYYAQAVGGHLALLAEVRPVEALLAEAATPAALRARLETARSIREFASRELGLPDNGSYRGYADIGRPFAVWNVVVAPEFSLEPLRSCFPVAGCVAYRGFFHQADAERYAEARRRLGNDVHVAGVPAYSTLGRLDDPLLSTFISYGDLDLARLLFHELAHQVAYARDDSTFNESFAVTVEREGARRWLAATGRGDARAALAESERRGAEFTALLGATRARLAALYGMPLAPEAMRQRKRAELEALRSALRRLPKFAAVEPSNAFLAAHATYTQLVPEFERLLAEEAGDLRRFYARVKALAAEEPSRRGAFAPRRSTPQASVR